MIVIPEGRFLELIARRQELGLRMLGSMSQHLRVRVGLVEDYTLKDVETRSGELAVPRSYDIGVTTMCAAAPWPSASRVPFT